MTIKELHKIVTELQERVDGNEEQIKAFILNDVKKIDSLYEAAKVIRGLNPENKYSDDCVLSIATHVGNRLEDWSIDQQYAEDALCAATSHAGYQDDDQHSITVGIMIYLDNAVNDDE